jgi:hypothetical protein
MLCASAISATAEPIDTQKIITALSGDFNGDGAQDLVMVVETKPGTPHDMHFFLRDKEHNYLKPVDVVREQVDGEWNGYDRPGYEASDTEPDLTALPNGSILLHIPALPIGAQRTDQTLTLAYREGKFIVAGFAYTYNDFQPDSDDTADALKNRCEYNVLTGKGKSAKRNDQNKMVETEVSVPGQVIAFRDWSFSDGLDGCENKVED